MINRPVFFTEYRKTFGRIPQSAVDCLNAIFDEFDLHAEHERDIEKKAYMLATVRHEVGADLVPITENMNYSAKRIMEVWPSRFKTLTEAQMFAHKPQQLANNVYGNRLGNGPPSSGDGFKYRGRGIGAQFTGRENYEKFGKLFNVNLVNVPELANDLKLGAKILYLGCMKGLFTGVALDKYINNAKVDYINARRVINADVARNGAKIASDARKFEKILSAAYVESLSDIPVPVKDTSLLQRAIDFLLKGIGK